MCIVYYAILYRVICCSIMYHTLLFVRILVWSFRPLLVGEAPECQILVFIWSFGPPLQAKHFRGARLTKRGPTISKLSQLLGGPGQLQPGHAYTCHPNIAWPTLLEGLLLLSGSYSHGLVVTTLDLQARLIVRWLPYARTHALLVKCCKHPEIPNT